MNLISVAQGVDIRLDLVSLGNLPRPTFSGKVRTAVVDLYEDDYAKDTRRIFTVTLHCGPGGRLVKHRDPELRVRHISGYDVEKGNWKVYGADQRLELPSKGAITLYHAMKGWIELSLAPYQGGPTHYRPAGWINPSAGAPRLRR